ncbi:hypothetical protein RDWZM_001485 [Blomia tropicalis]|uniref:Complexin n=1 Tax=Blomia tropicalis TaxID=40697 RepID=A0A9Q0RQS5_BLOTA|nr:hypothetical protein RDWZM_001485 [Blomia tropicalis]
MAAFIAKQMVGNQLSAVKDISVGDNLSAEEKERLAQIEKERLEALKEQEERRKEKHKKMEEEREKIRKGIRDKYNLKKKEAASMDEPDELQKRDSFSSETSLNRRKKSPDELMSEGEEDELTSMLCCI